MRGKFNNKRNALTTVCARWSLCAVFCLWHSAAGLTAGTSANPDWAGHRAGMLKDDGLVAYWTFEGLTNGGIANLKGAGFDLYAPQWTLVPGRWPHKAALHLNRSIQSAVCAAPRYDLELPEHGFSFECWFRPYKSDGPFIDDFGRKYGRYLLAAQPGGNWEGWALEFNNSVLFKIGQANGPVSIQSQPVTLAQWHHVVASWDGALMRLYIDGKLSASKPFAGIYNTKGAGFYPFQIGGIKSWGGLGAMECDYDEMAIYRRVLSEDEVQRHYREGLNEAAPASSSALGCEFQIRDYHLGYYPQGSRIVLDVRVAGEAGAYQAGFDVADASNRVFGSGRQSVVLSTGGISNLTFELRVPEACGLYWLQAHIRSEAAGARIAMRELPLAVLVKLPTIKDIPASIPLGGIPITGLHMPEARGWGFKWDRGWRYEETWFSIEKIKGQFNWEKTDAWVNEAVANGHEILYTIHGTPDWAAPAPAKNPYGDDSLPARDMADYERFLRVLVERYKDRIHYWEIWNEPQYNFITRPDQINGSGSEGPSLYTRMLRVAYKVIHELDPQGKVVGMDGYPGFLTWVDAVLKAGGGEYCDIISFHDYNYDNPNRWMQQRQIPQMKEMMRKYLGRELPLWNTEVAFAESPYVAGRPMTEEEFDKTYANRIPAGKDRCLKGPGCTSMVLPGYRSACWEIQSILLELAQGVEKRFVITNIKAYQHPYQKGIAFAALAKILLDWQTASFCDLGSDQATGVVIHLKDGKQTMALWTVNGQAAPIALLVNKDREYQGMDMQGNPLQWQAHEGVLNVMAGQAPAYIFDVPEDVQGARFIELQGPAVIEPNKTVQFQAQIMNPLKKRLEGALQLQAPGDWVLDYEAPVSLAPGAKTNRVLTVTVPGQTAGAGALQVQLFQNKTPIGVAQRDCLVRPVKSIPKTRRKIVLDGDTNDWAGIPGVTIDTLEHVTAGVPNPMFPENTPHWAGPADLSFTVRTVWDETALYLLVEVTDEHLGVVPENELRQNTYRYDCVEVYLDLRAAAIMALQSTGSGRLHVVPIIDDKPGVCPVVFRVNPGVDVRFVGHKTDKGYLIEGRMVPTGKTFVLAPGAEFGLNVAVDDGPEQKVQMIWTGGKESYLDASQWGRFKLVE